MGTGPWIAVGWAMSRALLLVVCAFPSPVHAQESAPLATAQSTITISIDPNPVGFGQAATFTSIVTNGGSAASGRVLFFDTFQGGEDLAASAALNASGVATATLSSLGVGAHSIIACWDNTGSASLPASCSTSVLSPALGLTVLESTTTTLTSSQNPVLVGTGVTLTTMVAANDGGGVQPAGTVNFANGANALCANIAINLGSATCAVKAAQLIQGANALTTTYGGDAAQAVLGSSSSLTENVQVASTLALTSVPNPSTYGQQVTVQASVTSAGSALPTGSIAFLDGGQQVGSATLAGSTTQGSFLTSSLAVGAHPLTAVYKGDSSHAASPPSATLTQIVNPTVAPPAPDFSLNVTPDSISAPLGGAATATVTLGSLNSFAASVTLSCSSLPAMVSCGFATNPLVLAAGGTQTTQLTVKIGGNSQASGPEGLQNQSAFVSGGKFRPTSITGFYGLLAIAPLGWGFARRQWRRRTSLLVLVLLLPAVLSFGCSGPGIITATLAGSHVLQVIASGSGVSHSQSLTVTITP